LCTMVKPRCIHTMSLSCFLRRSRNTNSRPPRGRTRVCGVPRADHDHDVVLASVRAIAAIRPGTPDTTVAGPTPALALVRQRAPAAPPSTASVPSEPMTSREHRVGLAAPAPCFDHRSGFGLANTWTVLVGASGKRLAAERAGPSALTAGGGPSYVTW
jgi:hypothetical protein